MALSSADEALIVKYKKILANPKSSAAAKADAKAKLAAIYAKGKSGGGKPAAKKKGSIPPQFLKGGGSPVPSGNDPKAQALADTFANLTKGGA